MTAVPTSKSLPAFTLTNPVFLAGKAAAACALALFVVQLLHIPDMVTASFVAVLCCSPAALMGLGVSFEQLAGSIIGGIFGTAGVYFALPQGVGVPIAVGLAILCTHYIGFYRGTVAASFTALFVQIVSFGDPLETFGYRIAAVCIAATSAFVVNVAVSSFFYQSLFRKRLRKMQERIRQLSEVAAVQGIAPMHSLFASLSQLNLEMAQARRELEWRRDHKTGEVLQGLHSELIWMRDYVHLVVDLAYVTVGEKESLQHFLSWLVRQEGPPPPLPKTAQPTRTRLIEHLQRQPSSHDEDRASVSL